MTAYQKLYTGIGRAAWGYFFIYFDFNINTVSILPSFIGYMLFLSAINCLCEEERELNLLRTLGVILTVWHVASWLASWGSIDLDGMLQVVDIIIGVVNIYFHFQLLTNLASIATKYQSADDELDAKLLRYRTLQTVMPKPSSISTRPSVSSLPLWSAFCSWALCMRSSRATFRPVSIPRSAISGITPHKRVRTTFRGRCRRSTCPG